MGRNPTSERKVRGKPAPGALVVQPARQDAGSMPKARRSQPAGRRRQPPIRAAYEHFRLERQGVLVSRSTLEFYDAMVVPFLTWLDGEGVERFEHMGVEHARLYKARMASTAGRHGRMLLPDTLHGSHRAIGTFLRWAVREGYGIDGRILDLPAPRIPEKEPTMYHIAQVRKVLAACNPDVPTDDLLAATVGIRCRVYPHLLRHSYITWAIRRGMHPVQVRQVVGHESTGMIDRIYSHLVRQDAHAAAVKMLSDDDDQ